MINRLLATMLTLAAELPETPYGAGEMERATQIRNYVLIGLAVIIVVFLIYWFTKKK